MPATLQISRKRLLSFDLEPCNAISKKKIVLEEENNCGEGINLTPQDRIGNTD